MAKEENHLVPICLMSRQATYHAFIHIELERRYAELQADIFRFAQALPGTNLSVLREAGN